MARWRPLVMRANMARNSAPRWLIICRAAGLADAVGQGRRAGDMEAGRHGAHGSDLRVSLVGRPGGRGRWRDGTAGGGARRRPSRASARRGRMAPRLRRVPGRRPDPATTNGLPLPPAGLDDHAPLAARVRPRDLAEFVGQVALVGERGAAASHGRARPAGLDGPLGAAGHRARRRSRACWPRRSGRAT